jgi:tryptophan-rich sensory protein
MGVGPVWTPTSAARSWSTAVQLTLNLAWSCLFFELRRPLLALLEIVVLLTFATLLEAGSWWLNR